MPKTEFEIEVDWRAAMADPDGPRKAILGLLQHVWEYFYSNSNLTRSEMETIDNGGPQKEWGKRLWRKLKADHNDKDICNTARILGVGQDRGWITFDPNTERFIMHSDSDDFTSLAWQIALSNWETTKKDLTLSHLNTMVRIGLQDLACATNMRGSERYSPDEAQKSLEKLTLLVVELNERMRQDQRPALPGADKS